MINSGFRTSRAQRVEMAGDTRSEATALAILHWQR